MKDQFTKLGAADELVKLSDRPIYALSDEIYSEDRTARDLLVQTIDKSDDVEGRDLELPPIGMLRRMM